MSDNNFPIDDDVTSNEVWPRKLNKLIIGVGILAFGLIIADRLINVFQTNDQAELVAIERTGQASGVELAEQDDAQGQDDAQLVAEQAMEEELDIEGVFGGRLVFVSASEPLYVVTDDERRFDVGGSIDEQTILAGITGHRVILERNGELMVIDLPEPQIQ